MRRFAGAAAVALLLSLACSWDGVRESEKPNEPPSVRITGGAADGNDVDYRVEFFWYGSDPDGTVDHFRYAIDDTCMCSYAETTEVVVGGDTLTVIEDVQALTAEECLARGIEPNYESPDSIWKRTERFSGSFNFSARNQTADPHQTAEWHTFHIRAVDDRGAVSPIDQRYFNATTIAPKVSILAPLPVGGDFATVSTFFNVRWTGRDEDSSELDKRPAGYQLKFIVIPDAFQPESVVKAMLTSPYNLAPNLLIPDSLVANGTYAATDWYPKAETPYTDNLIRMQNVPSDQDVNAYAFAVRAVDEAGSIMPDADLILANPTRQGSFIKLSVNSALEVHPYITVHERNFLGTKEFTVYGQEWETEVPANVPLRFEWDTDASWYGSRVEGVNFAEDIPDPGCEVCLDPEGRGGWIGWGNYDGVGRDIVFTEEDAGEQHRLYIRARDESFTREREMLAVVTMTVVAFAFDKTALWVDDCMFPSNNPNDCDYDDFLRPILTDAIAPYLQDGEVLEQWQTHRRGTGCTEINSAPLEMHLSRLARYQLLYWDVSNPGGGSSLAEVTDPDPEADRGKFLSIYVRAGGKLIVWGRGTIAQMLGDPETQTSFVPDLPIFDEAPWIYPGTFVWDILHFRTEFDRVGRGNIPYLTVACSGLLGMEATQKAIDEGFPAGVPDPTGFDPSRVGIWFDRWYRGEVPSPWGEPSTNVPTGVPPLRVAGLDTLYRYISNSWSYLPNRLREACGTNYLSPFESKPIVMRFDDPASPQGRVVWLGSQLWMYHQHQAGDVTLLMRRLTDWMFGN